MERDFNTTLRTELARIARFGANLADAYTCLIYLPADLLTGRVTGAPASVEGGRVEYLGIAAFHTLSNDLVRESLVPTGNGLIGWVAKHRRSIHVSPFDRDSTTLGYYSKDQQLKSFIGIPLILPALGRTDDHFTGVVCCDSKKSFSFTKLHGKLLEELAQQASSVISLAFDYHHRSTASSSWGAFVQGGERLAEALGRHSVEALRVRFLNLSEVEQAVGSTHAVELVDQVFRLIQQTLPPHFPSYRMPQGDIVLLVDNMMTAFYENKIRAVCDRVSHLPLQGASPAPLLIECVKRSFKGRRDRAQTVEQLITETIAGSENTQSYQGVPREYRTA